MNARITEWQAAVLREQLRRLPEQHQRRAARIERFEKQIASVPGLRPLARDDRVTERTAYQFILRYDSARFAGVPRDDVLLALGAEGVPCYGRFYVPIPEDPLFAMDPKTNPVARSRHRLLGRRPFRSRAARPTRSRSGCPTSSSSAERRRWTIWSRPSPRCRPVPPPCAGARAARRRKTGGRAVSRRRTKIAEVDEAVSRRSDRCRWDLPYLHAGRSSGVPEGEVVAVWSRQRENAERFAREFEIGFATDRVEELLPQVDVVCVNSPNACHAQHAIAAAGAGQARDRREAAGGLPGGGPGDHRRLRRRRCRAGLRRRAPLRAEVRARARDPRIRRSRRDPLPDPARGARRTLLAVVLHPRRGGWRCADGHGLPRHRAGALGARKAVGGRR